MGSMKSQQLIENVRALLTTRMRKQLVACDHGIGNAAEALGDLDTNPARVLAGLGPLGGADREVMVAGYQTGRNLHEHATQAAIGSAAQWAIGAIHLIALVTARHQAGTAGD